MILKEIKVEVSKDILYLETGVKHYEEVPQEELWEDGELSNVEVQQKILNHTMHKGDWMLVRRIDNG